MKRLTLPFLILLLLITITFALFWTFKKPEKVTVSENLKNTVSSEVTSSELPLSQIVAENLDTPWSIAFLPDGKMLVTERPGTVQLIDAKNGVVKQVLNLTSVKEISEGGLMGIAIHPKFNENGSVFLYYTYEGDDKKTKNRLSKFKFDGQNLGYEEILIDKIPGAPNHNGGRVKFGPDGNLYVTTGDAQEPSRSQDKQSLAGKILRVTDTGMPVSDNPFGNLVYSFGHRNPQGIVWDDDGNFWSTEHGPSGLETGNDELNKAVSGGNYGWPEIRGRETKDGMIPPIIESGKGNTWAPGGTAYVDGSIYFTGLRGSALYEYEIESKKLTTYFKGEYGRLRDVVVGPDGMLYVATSNRDGRGVPKSGDDKIIRINVSKLKI